MKMDMLLPILLIVAAFWLGACPFSLWIGRWVLDKDIRDYGDGNPGAANVFRAGSIKWGFLSVFLDIAKGTPFVALAHLFFGFSEAVIFLVGLSAILGHAFTPILGFKGGKAIAITFGVFLAIPLPHVFIIFLALMAIGFLLLECDSWRVIFSAVGALSYVVVAGRGLWEVLFMLGVLIILVVKHFEGLRAIPKRKAKIYIGFGQK